MKMESEVSCLVAAVVILSAVVGSHSHNNNSDNNNLDDLIKRKDNKIGVIIIYHKLN